LHRNCFLKHVIEGKIERQMEVAGSRGRKRKQLLDDLKEMGGYRKLKRGSTKSYLVKNSPRKGLWTYHNTDYEKNE
jgi:hypothetical protein